MGVRPEAELLGVSTLPWAFQNIIQNQIKIKAVFISLANCRDNDVACSRAAIAYTIQNIPCSATAASHAAIKQKDGSNTKRNARTGQRQMGKKSAKNRVPAEDNAGGKPLQMWPRQARG